MTIAKTSEVDAAQQIDPERELPPSADSAGEGPDEPRPDQASNKDDYQTLLDRFTRLQAEFDNFRKRVAREQLDFKQFAVADALSSMLPALDSFELALQSSPCSVEEFRAGMELIQRQLRDALGKLGLESVPARGELFNPHLHEAVDVVDRPEAADNQVIDELRRGYRLGDRLLRPSMVVVARNPGK